VSELEIGQKAKLKNRNAKNAHRVGKIWDIQDGIAHLTTIRQFGANENWHAPVEDLIHVCSERPMQGYQSYECGRPAKEGNLCGIHAGVRKRVLKNREREAEAARLAREHRNETALITKALEEQLDKRGLRESAPSLSVLHARNGTVSLKLDELLDLIRNA